MSLNPNSKRGAGCIAQRRSLHEPRQMLTNRQGPSLARPSWLPSIGNREHPVPMSRSDSRMRRHVLCVILARRVSNNVALEEMFTYPDSHRQEWSNTGSAVSGQRSTGVNRRQHDVLFARIHSSFHRLACTNLGSTYQA